MKGTKQDGPLGALWPPGRLELGEWRELLEALAADAERMIGRAGDLQAGCTLALRWVGLAWPCMSAEVIAASCRASLQLGEPPGVVVGLPLADQLQEIAERLDSIYEAAQADPGALAVKVRPPVLMAPPGVLPDLEPPKPRKPRRRGEAEPAEVDGADPEPLEVIEQEAQALAAEEAEPLEVIELPAEVEPEPEPEPEALEEQQPEQPAPVEHTTEEEAQLLPSWATDALEVAPADPAPPVVEQEQQDEPEPEPLDPSPVVEGMPPGWCDAVELAAAAGHSGISGLTRDKSNGRLVEGIHWRKAPPGLKLPGARKPLQLIWHLDHCLEVLGAADPANQLTAEQLRTQVRAGLREQGRRRRARRQLATDTLAELQAEGQQQQPTDPDLVAPVAAETMEVIEPLQQPEPPAPPPEVPPDVLAAAVAQALQQLGITPPPVPSTNGHREPVTAG